MHAPLCLILPVALVLAPRAAAQEPDPGAGVGAPPEARREASAQDRALAPGDPRIAWHGDLQTARVEARRTGRPILLMSGAPHCRRVPGMW